MSIICNYCDSKTNSGICEECLKQYHDDLSSGYVERIVELNALLGDQSRLTTHVEQMRVEIYTLRLENDRLKLRVRGLLENDE